MFWVMKRNYIVLIMLLTLVTKFKIHDLNLNLQYENKIDGCFCYIKQPIIKKHNLYWIVYPWLGYQRSHQGCTKGSAGDTLKRLRY